MSKQSVSEIIDCWETHGLQNLHEINLDRIYAFPLTRNDIDIRESSVQLKARRFNRRLIKVNYVYCVDILLAETYFWRNRKRGMNSDLI